MKKIIVFSFLLITGFSMAWSQELPNLKHIKLNKKIHYKEAEPIVIKVTDYLFATPSNNKNDLRREAGRFLMRWMDGAPNIVFLLEERQTRFFNTDTELMLIYMAGLAKYTLEHKTVTSHKEKVHGALLMVLPYLDKQTDKKAWSKELWQLMDAYQKDRLDAFLAKEFF